MQNDCSAASSQADPLLRPTDLEPSIGVVATIDNCVVPMNLLWGNFPEKSIPLA